MIAWYWIPIAASVSAALGLLLASILAAAKRADECADCMAARKGLAAYQAGETIPWEQVKAELAGADD